MDLSSWLHIVASLQLGLAYPQFEGCELRPPLRLHHAAEGLKGGLDHLHLLHLGSINPITSASRLPPNLLLYQRIHFALMEIRSSKHDGMAQPGKSVRDLSSWPSIVQAQHEGASSPPR